MPRYKQKGGARMDNGINFYRMIDQLCPYFENNDRCKGCSQEETVLDSRLIIVHDVNINIPSL